MHDPARTHRLFGCTLASDFPFVTRLAEGCGPADLAFACASEPPTTVATDAPAYASNAQAPDGTPALALYRLADWDLLHLAGSADFYIGAKQIICCPPTSEATGEDGAAAARRQALIEIQFLGTVLSLWLERQGVAALHASAVVVAGRAAGFLSANSGGKSALAAALMQAGHPLLTDDILPVEADQDTGGCLARPGYPTMRMWPAEARRFTGQAEDLPLVHPDLDKRRVFVGPDGFGAFHDRAAPLACLYLPQRRDLGEAGEGIEITPVSQRDAVVEMVRNSFTPRIVEAIGLQPQRLDFFAQMIQQIPVRRLIYPSGFEHLPRARDAILEDLANLRGS